MENNSKLIFIFVIILFITGIGILYFKTNTFENLGIISKENLQEQELDMKIKNVQIKGESIYLNLEINEKNKENISLSGIKFIIDDGENFEIIKLQLTKEEIDSGEMSFQISKVNSNEIKKIHVSPIYSGNERESVGSIKDTYVPSQRDYEFNEEENKKQNSDLSSDLNNQEKYPSPHDIYQDYSLNQSKLNQENINQSEINETQDNQTNESSDNKEINIVCNKNNYSRCYSGDVYWYDSCNQREEIKEICESNEVCQVNECILNEVEQPEPSPEPVCYEKSKYECYNGNVYWYDSCNNIKEIKESCGLLQKCIVDECYFILSPEPETECGNSILEQGEYCEGNYLAGENCSSFGFNSGKLSCNSECNFDTSNCYNYVPETIPEPEPIPEPSFGFNSECDCKSNEYCFNGVCLLDVNGDTYFVSTNGNDNNPGTFERPWKTWGKAFNANEVGPGDIVYFKGGVYYKDLSEGENSWYYPSRNSGGTGYDISRDGTFENPIYYYAYPSDFNSGNPPILDCRGVKNELSDLPFGIRAVNVNNVRFYGLHLRNVEQVSGNKWATGWSVYGDNLYIENCKTYNVHGICFRFGGEKDSNTYVINSDAYNCSDPFSSDKPGNDGSGFRHVTGGNVYYKGCRAWLCGDQGFSNGITEVKDASQYTEYENCWGFNNGLLEGFGHGFKMGWIEHTDGKLKRLYKNCIAVNNRMDGFKTNDYKHEYAVNVQLYNSMSYYSGYYPNWNYDFYGSAPGFAIHKTNDPNPSNEYKRILKNNLAYKNRGGPVGLGNEAVYTHKYNSWDLPITISDNDFVSLDVNQLLRPRKPDGSLPDITFGHLKPDSDLIDSGKVIPGIHCSTSGEHPRDDCIEWYGNAPDLGAFESPYSRETNTKSEPEPTLSTENIPFQAGWWIDMYGKRNEIQETISKYNSQENTLVLLSIKMCSTEYVQLSRDFLDELEKYDMKGIVRIICEDSTPSPISESTFKSILNSLENHPALYAFYLADEPAWTSDQSKINRRYNDLSNYYQWAKEASPNVPVFITHSMPTSETTWQGAERFIDIQDIYGIHAYPCRDSSWAEFYVDYERKQYDIWKRGLEFANANEKEFIATAQGFGNNYPYGGPYGTPSYNELRYQVFTAVVLGINKVLFWLDKYGEYANMESLVAQMIKEMQDISKEMNKGTTNSNQISISVKDRNKLVYRYGSDGNRHIILAINIANRESRNGETLSNVIFTVPSEASNVNKVNVLDEDRTISVSNRQFTDSFDKFQVHIYEFYT